MLKHQKENIDNKTNGNPEKNIWTKSEYWQRDRNYKKSQTKILELKNAITELKFLPEKFNSRLKQAEEKSQYTWWQVIWNYVFGTAKRKIIVNKNEQILVWHNQKDKYTYDGSPGRRTEKQKGKEFYLK